MWRNNFKYNYIHRIEQVPEKVVNSFPVKHTAHVCIWYKLKLTTYQQEKVLRYFPNTMYDQQLHCIIVRSSTLDCCLAETLLIKLYKLGTLTMHQLYSRNLPEKYYYLAYKKNRHLRKLANAVLRHK